MKFHFDLNTAEDRLTQHGKAVKLSQMVNFFHDPILFTPMVMMFNAADYGYAHTCHVDYNKL